MNALPDTTQSQNPDPAWQTELIRRKWLSEYTFELEFRRPDTFQFAAGQAVILIHEDTERHYSLVSAPHEPNFRLCLRHMHAGKISSILAAAEPGKQFTFKGPRGYFTFKPSSRSAVFIATGVGIAPFVSMAKSG